jgi:hypothetical protein
MAEKPKQIQAIDLVKGLFEHIHGNLGLLKFSVERLEPNNLDAMKWIVLFSFYKTLSSEGPTKYHANVDLKEKTVSVKEIDRDGIPLESSKKKYKVIEETEDNPEQKN